MNDFPPNTVLKGEISPTIYLYLLAEYVRVAPFLLPGDRKDPLNQPMLRHPGESPQNHRCILLSLMLT